MTPASLLERAKFDKGKALEKSRRDNSAFTSTLGITHIEASPTPEFIDGALYQHEQDMKIMRLQSKLLERALADLKAIEERCLCERATYGFDYHETHPRLGKPKPGQRFLDPRVIARNALAAIERQLKEGCAE